MYLSSLQIKNFRCFNDDEHIIDFNPGLTVLVGENDSGKSAIMDAIRIVLGTTDFGWIRIEINDFYNEDISREISISCKFSDLTPDEQASFLECLTYEKQEAENRLEETNSEEINEDFRSINEFHSYKMLSNILG